MRYLLLVVLFFSAFASAVSFEPICAAGYGYAGCGFTGSLQYVCQNPPYDTVARTECGSVYCGSGCTCPSNTTKDRPTGRCTCKAEEKWYEDTNHAGGGYCGPPSCPTGYKLNIRVSGGTEIIECVLDSPGDGGGDTCPSGFPKVNGHCAVCTTGYNPDGSCNDGCPAGKTKQGEVNGVPICVGSCTSPQVWGIVNGVEGCYGAPGCPNGGSYGSVNGVQGCYGSTGGNSGGSNSSSGGGSSSAGGGSGSGGAGGSSGSGSGSGGGDTGGGSTGGGSTGNNNGVGVTYPSTDQCPLGFVKDGNYCVSPDRGDCIVGYHSVVVSQSPLVFICTPDNPSPPSSAASSSPPQSSAASSQQSSQQSSANSASASSSGGASSSGAGGSGGNGNGGSGSTNSSGNQSSQGAGECDPTAKSYDECMGRLKTPSAADRDAIFTDAKTKNDKSLSDYETALSQDINQAKQGISFSNAPSQLQQFVSSYLPAPAACSPITFDVYTYHISLKCTYFDYFKVAMAWFLSVLCILDIWSLATRPVER